MKKFVIGISSLILILILILAFIGLGNKSKEQKKENIIQEKFEAIKEVQYDDIFTKEGNQLYYYYQPNCGYCNKLKPTIVEFYTKLEESDADLGFNKIDMAKKENLDGWYDWEAHHEKYGDSSNNPLDNPNYKENPADLLTVDDVKITGTPTILYVKDNQVQTFEIGNDEITSVLNKLAKEYKIDFNL